MGTGEPLEVLKEKRATLFKKMTVSIYFEWTREEGN